MILDQSPPGAFSQVGMFGGGSVWTWIASALPAVLGPYRIAAREVYSTGQAAGEGFVDGRAVGEVYGDGVAAGEVVG